MSEDGIAITRIAPTDRQHIQKYGPDGFTVSALRFAGPVLVFPNESLNWGCTSMEALDSAVFETVLERASSLDVCLLGCGARMQLIPNDVKAALKDAGVNIEPMDTGAACRTFNVLLAEGRAVCAALFPTR